MLLLISINKATMTRTFFFIFCPIIFGTRHSKRSVGRYIYYSSANKHESLIQMFAVQLIHSGRFQCIHCCTRNYTFVIDYHFTHGLRLPIAPNSLCSLFYRFVPSVLYKLICSRQNVISLISRVKRKALNTISNCSS